MGELTVNSIRHKRVFSPADTSNTYLIAAGLIKAVVLSLFVATPGLAHQATYFMPQIPDPSAIVIDGKDDDWAAWFDPAFAITPDIMFDIIGGPWPPPPDDWNCVLYVAWSAPPDNALYYFARVTDDSLVTLAEQPFDYWRDDSLEIIVDADHSSEPFGRTDKASAQQYGVRILPPENVSATVVHGNSTQWSSQQPYMTFGWTLDPPDAKPLEQPLGTTVTYTYEVRQKIWTFREPTGVEGSIEHVFAPDQIIGLTFQFDENDSAILGERANQPGTTPKDGASTDNSKGSDFITVPTAGATGGTPSAVGAASWGRLKTRMGR